MSNPKSQAWLDEYRATIGGSNAATICDLNEYQSAHDYFECRMERAAWPEFSPKNRLARWGTWDEPHWLQLAAEDTSFLVTAHPQDDFIYSHEYPWAHSLPDGWAYPAGLEFPRSVVEVKSPHPGKFSRIRLHGFPSSWVAQGLHNMAVTGAPGLLYVIGDQNSGNPLLRWLERDQEQIDDLMRLEREFDDALKTGVNPYIIPPDPVTETFEGGECAVLDDPAIVDAALALLEAKEMEDEAAEIVKDAKKRVADYMGENPVAEIPGLLRVYNKITPGRRTLPMKKALERYPDLESIVVMGDPFPTFRTYDLRPKGNR